MERVKKTMNEQTRDAKNQQCLRDEYKMSDERIAQLYGYPPGLDGILRLHKMKQLINPATPDIVVQIV